VLDGGSAALVHNEQTVSGRRVTWRQWCTGALWANSQGASCHVAAVVHRCTMSKQSGDVVSDGGSGAPVHYGQIVRGRRVGRWQWCTGALWANSQGPSCHVAAVVHRCTMSKQSGPACLPTGWYPFTLPRMPSNRGLHSFTSQLNLSAFYGIRGARRGRPARVKGVLGGG